MILVAGTVSIDPGKKAGALKLMKEMMEATVKEEGCISYRFYMNPWQDGEVFIFEEWETLEALQSHFQTPHMANFNQHLPEYVVSESKIMRYTVSEVASL